MKRGRNPPFHDQGPGPAGCLDVYLVSRLITNLPGVSFGVSTAVRVSDRLEKTGMGDRRTSNRAPCSRLSSQVEDGPLSL